MSIWENVHRSLEEQVLGETLKKLFVVNTGQRRIRNTHVKRASASSKGVVPNAYWYFGASASAANDGVFRSGGDQSLQKRTAQHACGEGDAKATGASEVFASLAQLPACHGRPARGVCLSVCLSARVSLTHSLVQFGGRCSFFCLM